MKVRYSFSSRRTGHIENIRKQKAKIPEILKEVISISDIILEVIDSRFINEMRNKEVERLIEKKGSKVIFVFNKCDLVDVEETKKRVNKDLRPFEFVSTKTGFGINELRKRIKIEAKKIKLPDNMKRVHVGIIGYPNTGKSSLINKLSRRGVASTSKQAGHTKGIQKIKFSKNIILLDTPGVIPQENYSTSDTLKNVFDAKVGSRDFSNVKDPESVVYYLITPIEPKDINNPTKEELEKIEEAKRNAKAIERYYSIDFNGDFEKLIEELGKKKNFLKKGGIVDSDRTARLILKDWQEGNIRV